MGRGRCIIAGLTTGACAILVPVPAHAVLAAMCSQTQPQCERASISVSKLVQNPNDFDYDTGWVPSNSPVQVRLVVSFEDNTDVALAGTLDSTWPDPITLTPNGTPGQGQISINDGFEVTMQARFTVSVGGQTYSWTGNIPYVPNVNFIASATQNFNPWQWTGEDPANATVIAQTATQRILQVSLTQSLIPIPGISGGVELDGSATYSAWYDTLRIAFDEMNGVSPIPLVDPNAASTTLLITPSPSFDTNVFIHGEVTEQMTLHFIPAFYFDILGDDFTLPLADLPLALPASNPIPWDFDPVAVHVPLPKVYLPKTEINVGTIPVGAATKESVVLTDMGEEILEGTVDTLAPMADIETAAFSISPQQSVTLELLLTPETAGPFDVLVRVASNDPLTPNAAFHVTGIGGGAIGESGGCGCDLTSRSTRWDAWALVALGATLVRRRSGRRRS